MIKIQRDNLDELANEWWEKLNKKLKKKIGNSKNGYRIYHEESLIEKLRNKANNQTDLGKLYSFFLDESNDYKFLKEIVISNPKEMNNIIEKVNGKMKELGISEIKYKSTKGEENFDKIFNYDVIRKNEIGYWFGKNINSNVCPYCNREHTFTYRTKDNKPKLLYDLDHFFDKATYPYLSLSFYNLVPSCGICNRIFKHEKHLNLSDNFHPYLEGFSDELRFSINNTKSEVEENIKNYKPKISNEELKEEVEKHYGVAFFYGDLDSFRINFKYKKNITLEEKNIADKALIKDKGNVDIFQLKEVYNQHKDYVVDIIQKNIVYNDDYIESLFKQFEGTLFRNKEDLMRFILGNYISEEDLGKRPLAKLTRDISEELGLL